MKPLAIDLFTGLHGWAEGLASEGWDVIGFDIKDMCAEFGRPRPAGVRLVLQDVMTIHGSQFKNAHLIVCSPPCQKYSWLAMPWSRSKSEHSKAAKDLRRRWETEGPDNRLFDACFRIQREAIEATRKICFHCLGGGRISKPEDMRLCLHCNGGGSTTRFIPLIVENVRGANEWVSPKSRYNYGPFHLWGDVPAIMPIQRGKASKTGKNGSWFRERNGIPQPGIRHEDRGTKQPAGNGDWFSKEARDGGSSARFGSKSLARKAASAKIAKIPPPLAEHIARVFKPGCSPQK